MRKSKYKTDFTIYLVMERTTKNAVRYMETAGPDDDTPVTTAGGAKVGVFYARKSAFTRKIPRRLIVRVRPGKRRR